MTHVAEIFRRLHGDTIPLRLPNAWDAGSARLFESQGASAIATTSAGVAWALGYRDGRRTPIDEVVAVAARITRVLTVPVSIDIENGYSDDPKKVADNVKRLADLGVAGINIEDGSDGPSLLAAKIEAIGNALSKAGAVLFVNARCDAYLANLVEKSKLVEESIARGKTYMGAGAGGFFLPGIVQAQHIRAVAAAVSLPLNVMAWPGLAEAGELGKLGVRRLSAGSAISQVLWGTAALLARDFLNSGRSDPLSEGSMPYPQLQGLFPEK
ncbi:MAG TPA: isocitrate lyase/phosphoenolpyruvate mutase family protein [Steroidobacteraceae bacterium]